MIRLSLGGEPPALTRRRPAAWRGAQAEFDANGPGRKELHNLLTDYDNDQDGEDRVKRVLWRRQHEKCAWCEVKADWELYPVEHIRPKGGAYDLDEAAKRQITSQGTLPPDLDKRWTVLSPDHYWWLTWEWENLVFSCARCNKTGNKGNRFPLAPGRLRTAALPRPVVHPLNWPGLDVSHEETWLLNPRLEGSQADITWGPTNPWREPEDWTWEVRGRTPRGMVTIEVLGLKDRIDRVSSRLKELVARWRDLKSYMDAGRAVDVANTWESLVSTYIEDPDKEFRAACWCALNLLVLRLNQKRWKKLNLRSPAVPEVHHP